VPLSDAARQAVEVVTARNPRRAQLLLDLLRTAPEAVRRKPKDRYGLLRRVLHGPPEQPELSKREGRLCEEFHQAWLSEEFTIAELADALEAALGQVTGVRQDPNRHRADGWRTLAGRPRRPDALIGRAD
jgi:hypothetical protein